MNLRTVQLLTVFLLLLTASGIFHYLQFVDDDLAAHRAQIQKESFENSIKPTR